MTALVQAGKVRCLGVSELGLWQLQRITEPAGILRPTFHQISVSLRSAQHDVVRWCHSRAIEVVAFLEASPTVLRSEHHERCYRRWPTRRATRPHRSPSAGALQHGLVTIPQLGSLIKDPGNIASDDVYRQWLSAMAEKLREIYSLLHPFTRRPKFCSPTRIRQVTLSKDQVAALDDLDAVRIATRKHIESTLAQWATTTADTDPLADGGAPPPDDAPEAITVELAGELLDAPDEAEAGPDGTREFLPAEPSLSATARARISTVFGRDPSASRASGAEGPVLLRQREARASVPHIHTDCVLMQRASGIARRWRKATTQRTSGALTKVEPLSSISASSIF